MGQRTLRITINQHEQATMLTLEGRVEGPWAAELGSVWGETSQQLGQQKVSIDISNVIYADADGIKVLREIFSQTQAKLVANTPWTRHLAAVIAANPHD